MCKKHAQLPVRNQSFFILLSLPLCRDKVLAAQCVVLFKCGQLIPDFAGTNVLPARNKTAKTQVYGVSSIGPLHFKVLEKFNLLD